MWLNANKTLLNVEKIVIFKSKLNKFENDLKIRLFGRDRQIDR